MIGAYRGSCTRPHSLNSVQHVVCQLQAYRLFPVLGLGYDKKKVPLVYLTTELII